MLRTVLLALALLLAGCVQPEGHDGNATRSPASPGPDAPDDVSADDGFHVHHRDGPPLPERLGLAEALAHVDGNISWAFATLEDGTTQRWELGGVRGGDQVTWSIIAAGTREPRHPGPGTHYPDGAVLARVGGPVGVPAVPPGQVDSAEVLDGRVWWDVVHGWSRGGETAWNGTWRDWSSAEVVTRAPGAVLFLQASERERGFQNGALVPPDPLCGDGRAVQWVVGVREDGRQRRYTFTNGVFVAGERIDDDTAAVPWHDSADIDWPDLCLGYTTGAAYFHRDGEQVREPRWEAYHLLSDTVLTWSYDARTGEKA